MEYHQIIIIGAGMAGLGAATTLHQNNIQNFIVLEAKDEIGGRIKTILVNDKHLDVGAQWLHGRDNPLYDIAKRNNLLSDETSEEGLGLYVRNDGVIFDKDLVKRVEFKIGQILENCQEFVREENFPRSVGSFLEEEFNKYLDECNDSSDIRQMKLELLDWHVRFQIIDNSCCSLNRLSAKSWGDYECLDDVAHFNLKNGYKSLVDHIVMELPKDIIKCQAEVIKIEFDNKLQGKIKVTTSNHQVYTCDHLILTISLGVLKDFHIANIFPNLPKHTTTAINEMGFDGICKIYLFFDTNWWGDAKAFQLIWRREDILAEIKEDNWVQYLTGFDEVFGQPTALLGWVGGEGVREVEEMSEEEIGEKCVALLRKFVPQFQVPAPKRVIRTRWLSDPYFKGSYCHITPECDNKTLSAIHQLAQPVLIDGIPRILLAGEAVSPSHYSTTHGAFESGQEQAQICIDFLKNTDK